MSYFLYLCNIKLQIMKLKKELIEFLSMYGSIEYVRFIGDECQFKLTLSKPVYEMTPTEFTIFLMKITDNILFDYPNFEKFNNGNKFIEVTLSK